MERAKMKPSENRLKSVIAMIRLGIVALAMEISRRRAYHTSPEGEPVTRRVNIIIN